jgi:hypothetical protein
MNHLAWKHVKYGDKSNFFRSLIIVIERTKSNSLNDKILLTITIMEWRE